MNKNDMRMEARSRLSALGPEQRSRADEAIAQHLWKVDEVGSARAMLLYASADPEVDTDAIAREAVRRGITLTYPRCLPESRAMVLHRVEGLAELRGGGSYGIREPDVACAVVDMVEVDVALVPGLAWDRTGTRLGRGAGYYDRLFMNPLWRGFRCGLFYAAQEFYRLPANRFDAPLDAVVTEKGVVRFERNSGPPQG